MKIAVLSDIHGNIIALKKCIEHIEKLNIKHIIFCGDYISDIPRGHEVIAYLKELKEQYTCYFVRGNREEYILDYLNGKTKEWSLDNRFGPMLCALHELDDSDLDFIKELPASIEVSTDGLAPIFVSHKRAENIRRNKYMIYGHNHKPEYYYEDGIYYINPGSVGLGTSNGYCVEFAVLDIENNQCNVELLNIKYNPEEVIKSIRESELTKTRIRWDQILIGTIEKAINCSYHYANNVIKKGRMLGINDADDIPMSVWDEVRKELLGK